ncbi:hypothetical protein ABIG07_007548 [Bradyrhizobium ottawaense]|uniref:Uncharacterized protein n=1 Tax=Bradyrhizobium ottawaense TaxID=931866 RepID=A0ABV4G5E1_9BRAD
MAIAFAVGVLALVEIAARHDGVADQLRAAFDLAGGEHHARLCGLELGVGLVDLGGVRRRIDLEQHVASLHQRAFGEVGRKDRTGDTRAELDAVDGFQPAGEVVPQRGLPRLDHGDGDGHRLFSRGGRCGCLGGTKIVAGRNRTGYGEGAHDGDAAKKAAETAGVGGMLGGGHLRAPDM